VLIANELVGRENIVIISRLIEDSRFEFFCLVDSAPQVNALSEFFGANLFLGIFLHWLGGLASASFFCLRA
jgi:hypothetical protein